MDLSDGVQRQRIYIAAESDVYNAAMLAYSLVQQAGARTLLATEAATVVSELGMNIVKYAGRGNLTLSVEAGAQGYVEVRAEDHGPGIGDVDLALTDSWSSRGTLGLGLPGVRRMSDQFEIRSRPGAGTAVRARRNFSGAPPQAHQRPALATARGPVDTRPLPTPQQRALHPSHADWQHAQVKRPCFGEVVSGDGCVLQALPHGLLAGVLDVLGHGVQAHALARHCEHWLQANAHADVVGLVEGLHRETRGSLGLALTLAFLDPQSGSAVVAGVGNTRLFSLGAPASRIEAQPGIVGGANMPRLRPARLQILPQDTLILMTDGISERLDARTLLPLRHQSVQRIAQQLLREHGKDHDDATCLVLRCPG